MPLPNSFRNKKPEPEFIQEIMIPTHENDLVEEKPKEKKSKKKVEKMLEE